MKTPFTHPQIPNVSFAGYRTGGAIPTPPVVRTQITINNDAAHGGSDDAGPLYGQRFAHWGITVTNGRAGGVKLDTVAPRSATARPP